MTDVNIDLDKDTEEKIRQIAEKNKTNKSDVIKTIIKEMLNDKEDDVKEHVKTLKDLSSIKEGGDENMLDRLISLIMLQNLAGKKDDTGEIMKFAMLKQMLQSNTDPIMTEIVRKALEGGNKQDNKLLETYLQNQMQMQQMMMQMLFNTKIEESKRETQNIRNELADRLQQLENALYTVAQSNQQPRQDIFSELEKYKRIREGLMEVADELGINKKDVSTADGKVNWGALIERLLGFGEKALTKISHRPELKPIAQIPEFSNQFTQEPQPAIQPEISNIEPKFSEEVNNNVSDEINTIPSNIEQTGSEASNIEEHGSDETNI